MVLWCFQYNESTFKNVPEDVLALTLELTLQLNTYGTHSLVIRQCCA